MTTTRHPLDGARARVARAARHIAELEEHVRNYVGEYDYATRVRVDQDGRYSVEIDHPPDVPVELSLIVSDAIHNLRTALDYIVYELARHDSGTEQPGTQFLIENIRSDPRDKNKGFQAKKRKYLRGLSDAHVRAIEALQPFNGVKWTAVLRDISNPDKHRHLHATGAVWDFKVWLADHTDGWRDRPGRLLVGAGPHGSNLFVERLHAVDVLLADAPVIGLLQFLQAKVGGVIELFEGEF